MTVLQRICVLVILLLAGGVAGAVDAPHAEYLKQHMNLVQPDCNTDDCPRLRVNWPIFIKDNPLTGWIDHQLTAFATGPTFDGDCGPAMDYLQTMADYYFRHPKDVHVTCALYANVKYDTPSVVVFDLNVGAGKHWASRTVVYDRKGKKSLMLADLLLPGQLDKYYGLFADAEASAFDANSTDCPWPRSPGNNTTCEFPRSEEFELTAEGVSIVFQIPPRVAGGEGNTLRFPATYAQLQGIIRPEWLPVAASATQ